MNGDLDRVLFVGGGTGGTVGPGIAIAERLRTRRPSLGITFVVSDRPVDRRMLESGGWDHLQTPARSPARRPDAAWAFLRGWWGTRRAVRPAMSPSEGVRVVALGGFVAPPAVAEAVRCRIPVDLVNLDAVAGRANRWVATRATRVFTAVETDLEVDEPPIGVPLRRAVLPSGTPGDARRQLGLDPDRRTLLITGASQGARSIDRFMLGHLAGESTRLRDWQVVHLAGGEIEALEAAYAAAGVPASVRPFLESMGVAWTAADLAISRGGASSIAEIAASRTPALILPYPWHRDRHQARNAEALRAAGGVEVLDDPVENGTASVRLADTLESLLGDSTRLEAMREAMPTASDDAAERLARLVLGD